MLGHPGQGRRAGSTQRVGRRGPHTQWACSSRAHTQQSCVSEAHGKKAGRSWAHRRPAGSPQSSWRGTRRHGAGCGQGRGQGWSGGSFPGAASIPGLWRPGHEAPGCLPRGGLLSFLLVPSSGLLLEFPVAVTQFRKLLLSWRLTVTQRPCDFWNRSLGWMGKGRQVGTGAPLHDFQGPPQFYTPCALSTEAESHSPHQCPPFQFGNSVIQKVLPQGRAPHWGLWPRYGHNHNGG